MNDNHEKKKLKRSRSVWWPALLLIAVIIAVVLWFYLHSDTVSVAPEEKIVRQKIDPGKVKDLSGEQAGYGGERHGALNQSSSASPPGSKPYSEKVLKAELDKSVADFFLYLDSKEYIQGLGRQTDTYTRFKQILERLAANPPIPAGENEDPTLIIKNLYHFFRVLGQEDIRLITGIMRNEQDTMEYTMEMFYKWVTLGERSSSPDDPRPSMEAIYPYSGFFLNTVGGRAYMFRRTMFYRLLSSYYSVLIVHKADKAGKNIHGIDILPVIAPLRNEISHYPELEFQDEYVEQLNKIERYYMEKR